MVQVKGQLDADQIGLGLNASDPSATEGMLWYNSTLKQLKFHNGTAATTVPMVPIGGMIPWAKSLTGVPVLPSGWLECNGQTISDVGSPMNGTVLPDMNNQGWGVVGNLTSGGTNKTEDFLPNHNHVIDSDNTGAGAKGTSSQANQISVGNKTAGTALQFYKTVWIIRIK